MKHYKLISFINVWLVLMIVVPAFAQSPKPIKIGLMYSLTGVYSTMGTDSEKGARNWIEWANAKGGIQGHRIEFVMFDDQSDSTKAVLNAKKLEAGRVYAISASNATGVALAVGPVFENEKIPYVTCSGSEVFEQTLKPYWGFRTCTSSWAVEDWKLECLKLIDSKTKNIAILYQGAAFGKASYDSVRRYAPLRGLQIVAEEKYDPVGTDFGAQISSLMKKNPDAIVVCAADMGGFLALRQMREMGFNKSIIVNIAGINSKTVPQALKDVYSIPPHVYAVGLKADVWAGLPKDSVDYKVIAPVASRFEEKYKEDYTWFHHISVCNLTLITDSLQRALREDPNLLDRDLQTIRAAIRDKIEAVEELQSGSGVITGIPRDRNLLVQETAIAVGCFRQGKLVYDPKLSSSVKLNPPPPVPK